MLISDALDEPLRARLDDLFSNRAGRTIEALKRESKRPRPREAPSFLEHIQAMNELAEPTAAAKNSLAPQAHWASKKLIRLLGAVTVKRNA
ncbi:hypothetical protein ACIP1U_27315 [Cupriavidus sp. NPDC089707]|uniref:hypothetical protein n=1 Tax=Cupriavidus sp. NPDC089707 TaxID=3363963 RepID=UPI0038168B68